jgi:hypothetical protein
MHKKGLKSIAESTPDFSNQALENAINDIKNIDQDVGYLWTLSNFTMDTAIRDNTVLTTSQKNDALETIYAQQPHLHIGRYLNDMIRHAHSIIDGSIIPTTEANAEPTTFLDILQEVQSVQNLIPSLFGCTPEEKSRGVNDHFGTLNNMFLEKTEDSSLPVFTRLANILKLINARAQDISTLAIATAAVAYSSGQLTGFLNTITDDSTDFQTTLDNKVNTVAGNMANLNTRISELPGDPTVDLIAIRDEIVTQVNLENSNITGIEDYTRTLANNLSYSSVAEDPALRKLMAKVAQNDNWKTYLNDFEKNKASLNPIYNIMDDSDKSFVIDDVLASRGLPDITDHLDLEGVVNKAKRDSRIDTKDFNQYSIDKVIEDCCKQLGLYTFGDVYSQSQRLLSNLNQRDRDIVADELDLNEDADTLS